MSDVRIIQLIKSQTLKADLVEIDKQFESSGFKDMSSIVLFKQALVGISNLVDFEPTVRSIYAENRDLSKLFKEASREFDFAKYLRNIFIGHVQQDLLMKALEWKPELRYALNNTESPEGMFLYNLWILETAINSYVDQEGNHKVFDSETDLMYPPNTERFLIFLTTIVKTGLDYLEALSNTLKEGIEFPDPEQQDYSHWISAGKTAFEYIKKGR